MQVFQLADLPKLDFTNARSVALSSDTTLFPGTGYGVVLTVDHPVPDTLAVIPEILAIELPPFLISLLCEERLQGRLEAQKKLRQALGLHRWNVSIDSRPVYDSETKTIVEK